MTVPPRKFREIVFQLLYSHDLAQPDANDVIPFMCAELEVSRSSMRAAHERMEAVLSVRKALDVRISEFSKEYALDRIPRVERNILRLALFELLEDREVPPKVAIAEAMRLTRKFSSPDAGRFVNAVLDAAYKAELAPEEGEDDKEAIFFGNGDSAQ